MTGRRRRRSGTFIYARDREEETTSSGLQRAGPSANNLILLVFLVTGQRPSARRTSDNNKKKKTNAKGNIRPSTFCRGYFRTPSNTQTHARVGQIITRADTSRLDCNTHRRKSARGSLLCHWWRNDIVRLQSKREQRNRSDGPSRLLRTNSCSILGRRLDHLGQSGGFDPSPSSSSPPFVYIHLLYIIDIISLKPRGDLCLVGRNRSLFSVSLSPPVGTAVTNDAKRL